jgi:hypothetical protein
LPETKDDAALSRKVFVGVASVVTDVSVAAAPV